MTSVADPPAESGAGTPATAAAPAPVASSPAVPVPVASAPAAPAHATPEHATPAHATSEHATPEHGTPAHGATQPPWAGPGSGYPAPETDRLTRLLNRVASRSPRWLAPVALLGCAAGAVGYTLLAVPPSLAPDAVPTCLLKYTTGFDCPGCGGTRAFWYLLQGDLPAASRHHLLFVFVLPFLIYLYVAWAGRQLFGWKLPQLRPSPAALGYFLAAWGVFTVLRNLPWPPFTAFYV